MAPFRGATSDLGINIGSLCTMFGVRLVMLLLLTSVMFLVLVIEAVVHLLTETAAVAEQTSLALLIITAESSRAFFSFELALLRRVLTALLSTAFRIWEPLVSGRLVGVLLIIDEIPAL